MYNKIKRHIFKEINEKMFKCNNPDGMYPYLLPLVIPDEVWEADASVVVQGVVNDMQQVCCSLGEDTLLKLLVSLVSHLFFGHDLDKTFNQLEYIITLLYFTKHINRIGVINVEGGITHKSKAYTK